MTYLGSDTCTSYDYNTALISPGCRYDAGNNEYSEDTCVVPDSDNSNGYLTTEFYTGDNCDGDLILTEAVAINTCVGINGTVWTKTTGVSSILFHFKLTFL